VSIEFFDEKVYPLIGPFKIADNRGEPLQRVDQVAASGGTALYQALADAYREAKSRSHGNDRSIRALVVMTDGRDEHSSLSLPELESSFPREGQDTDVRVFTIAYGNGASSEVLDKIANAGGGSNAKGTVVRSAVARIHAARGRFRPPWPKRRSACARTSRSRWSDWTSSRSASRDWSSWPRRSRGTSAAWTLLDSRAGFESSRKSSRRPAISSRKTSIEKPPRRARNSSTL
jgi:hypothetical protein